MKIQTLALMMVLTTALFVTDPILSADNLKFSDGREVEGVIKKVESGRVFIVIGEDERTFDILEIVSMDFTTPHLLPMAPNVPLDHFLKSIEAQELVRNVEELKKSEEEIRRKLAEIQSYWMSKQPVDAAEIVAWEAAKAEFEKPLHRYQELLNDMYFHVLAEVDKYNLLAEEASKTYVGVRGIRTGSSLVSKDMRNVPLRKFVPGNWYNTIFYDGYYIGFSDAQRKMDPVRNPE